MKKTQKILIIGMSLFALVGITTLSPAPVQAADCATSVLPDSLCGNSTSSDVEDTGVWLLLIYILNILTAGVGVAALGGIIYGAILYTSAGGSQEQTKKAMGIITNVVVGVIAYALMYGFLNFLIPGGIFN